MTTIGLAIPTIPPRADLLVRAVASAGVQTRPLNALAVAMDVEHKGAAATRNHAWQQLSSSDYIAFLDDDDELLPMHLERCLDVALAADADLVYPWFEVVGGTDPFPETHFTDPWDPAHPVQTTVTTLWRREALEAVGGFPELGSAAAVDAAGNRIGEDFAAVLALNDKGGKIVHLPERTWLWYHHATNTSGLPDRW